VARARPRGFQIAGEVLDLGAAGAEQAQVMLPAPAGELGWVQFIRLTCQAAAPGEEPG
jgi:hypothetical protein